MLLAFNEYRNFISFFEIYMGKVIWKECFSFNLFHIFGVYMFVDVQMYTVLYTQGLFQR